MIAVVAIALLDRLRRPTRLLAARRTEPPPLSGFWELPGGKVDPGESWRQALHREIAEELGVAVELGQRVRGPRPDGRWMLSERHVMSVWFGAVTSGQPRPLQGHDALRWLTPPQFGEVAWLDGNRPVVDLIADRWQEVGSGG